METVKCKLTKEEFENILARLDNLANSIEILTVEVLSNIIFILLLPILSLLT